MYRKIMVPLDGSELAECVLPQVEEIVGGCGAESIWLVRVVEDLRIQSEEAYASFTEADWKRMESDRKKAVEEYLDRVAGRLKVPGSALRTEVLMGRVNECLSGFAEANGVDLIVLATHGRSGISRLFLGSVAEKLLRSSCAPVLMVRAPGCFV